MSVYSCPSCGARYIGALYQCRTCGRLFCASCPPGVRSAGQCPSCNANGSTVRMITDDKEMRRVLRLD